MKRFSRRAKLYRVVNRSDCAPTLFPRFSPLGAAHYFGAKGRYRVLGRLPATNRLPGFLVGHADAHKLGTYGENVRSRLTPAQIKVLPGYLRSE